MTPKFSVGEVVILQSVSLPDYNGEYSVAIVIIPGFPYTDPETGINISNKPTYSGPAYILHGCPAMEPTISGNIVCQRWLESALRKKHQPGELSYSELLQSLTVKTGAPA